MSTILEIVVQITHTILTDVEFSLRDEASRRASSNINVLVAFLRIPNKLQIRISPRFVPRFHIAKSPRLSESEIAWKKKNVYRYKIKR